MGKNVLLTVDLNTITSEQRTIFNDALRAEQWAKHNRLTTTWTAVFKDGGTEEGAIAATKTDVQNAAIKAKISSYDVLIHVGDAKPTEYSKRP